MLSQVICCEHSISEPLGSFKLNSIHSRNMNGLLFESQSEETLPEICFLTGSRSA